MNITWKDKTNPNLITEQIERIKTIGDGGKVQFLGFEFEVLITLLHNCLIFPPGISEIKTRQLLRHSIFETSANKRLTPDKLKLKINELVKEFLSTPQKRFVLVSLISLSQLAEFNSIYLDKSRVYFEKRLSHRFDTKERQELAGSAYRLFPTEIPKDYSYVRIHVSSRTHYDAADQALENIDFIRGIWNYLLNRSFSYRKTMGGNPIPINKITLGPIYTLHNLDGKLACNQWWFDPSYRGKIKPYASKQEELNNLKNFEQFVRMKLKTRHYQNDLRSAIIRYSKALDDIDMYTAFLKLWGVLEFLTGSSEGTSHEVTIRRVASLYENREYHLQALRILKDNRNSYVHHGEETNEQETFLIQLKNYVESLIQFHITNKFNFPSLAKSAEFLDLPADKDTIKYKLQLYNYAKRFRNY